MKLPGKDLSTNVPRMAKLPYKPKSSSDYSWAEAMNMIGHTAEDIASTIEDYQIRDSQRASLDADRGVEEALITFDGEQAGKQVFQNSEIPEDLRHKLNIPEKGETPSYKVLADWRYKVRGEAIKNFTSSIEHRGVRDKWTATQYSAARDTYHQDLIRRSREQEQYLIDSGIEKIAALKREGNFAGAIDYAGTLPIPKLERQAMVYDIMADQQVMYLDSMLEQVEGQTSVEYIQQLETTYQQIEDAESSVIGHVPEKRGTYMRMYRRRIEQITNDLNAGVEGKKRNDIKYAGQVLANLKNMDMQTPEAIQKAKEIYAMYPGYEHELETLDRVEQALTDIPKLHHNFSPYEISRTLQTNKNEPTDTYLSVYNKTIQDFADSQIPVFNTDVMQYAHNVGHIVLDDINPADAASVQKRLEQREAVSSSFHRDANFLTINEVKDISRYIESLPPAEQNAWLSQITSEEGMGSKASLLWDQMQEHGEGGILPMLGQLHAVGQEGAANAVAQGYKWLKADKNHTLVTTDMADEVELSATDLHTLFVTPQQFQQASLAVKAAMAYFVQTEGYDRHTIDKAIQLVTGPTVEFNDKKIRVSDPKLTDRTFRKWLQNSNPELYTKMDPKYRSQIKKLFDSERVYLLPTGKRDSWFVMDEMEQRPISSTEGGKFILTYDRYNLDYNPRKTTGRFHNTENQ